MAREKKIAVMVYLSPDDYLRLEILAERTMSPLSRLIREAVHEFVKEVTVVSQPGPNDVPLF